MTCSGLAGQENECRNAKSQVVNYEEEALEKLYTFGRFLYKELPKDAGGKCVEFDDELALQYHRLEKMDEGAAELDESCGEVSVPTETDTRSQEVEEVGLSTLVKKINEKLSTDFTDADQLFLEQLKEYALEDEQLRQSAKVNSEENFALEFDSALTELFIDPRDLPEVHGQRRRPGDHYGAPFEAGLRSEPGSERQNSRLELRLRVSTDVVVDARTALRWFRRRYRISLPSPYSSAQSRSSM